MNGLKAHQRELINLSRRCIPLLKPELYKGQCGKICVVGGCEEYTGAPYFSAHAASTFGSDLVYVLCERKAGLPIKAYSPNLMVHPYLVDSYSATREPKEEPDFEKILGVVQRCHVLVIGPGLGRDKKIREQVIQIVQEAASIGGDHNRCLILDADALFVLSTEDSEKFQEALKKYGENRVIITPNAVELKRIMKALNVDTVEEVSKRLGCITVAKGHHDIIINSKGKRWENDVEGSMKRCGGQGDTLTGVIASMLGFSRAVHDWKLQPLSVPGKESVLPWDQMAMLSCYVGSTATKMASKAAYEKVGRQMQTTDMNYIVGEIFEKLYDTEGE
ncbi:uncharacterized protein YKL151C [Kluyveromyces marxianus]|uniref:ATP-dependent (S)-NAD(P)H-hydrate dehydratase n=2 Tax=Kluyveromyces marxianus TaxID=4911 RepID=W0T5P0_KLUMD|nr:uncharacterized protein KLMA_20469 [Kluyveromyces marxianus DMKU3-1042]QGN14659.1 YKL151C [Kluyveromyces marxianus]BAO38927.1 uncharacterized protein YKL151C [Kluyveromyces marxianus DMKU3-1042]BAP70459.1 uncharacterized protein YKL151C [Kluyveromyces marxianus]